MHIRRMKIVLGIIIIGLIMGAIVYAFSIFSASAQTQPQRGVQRILVLDSFTKGAETVNSAVWDAEFVFEFAPIGTFKNVSYVYINAIFSNPSPSSYYVYYRIGPYPYAYNILQQGIGEAPGTTTNWVRAVTTRFDNSEIAPGMNKIEVYTFENSFLCLYRLELLVEYYYFP